MEDEIYRKHSKLALVAQRCGGKSESSDVVNDKSTSSLRLMLDGRILREHTLVCFVDKNEVDALLKDIEKTSAMYK